MFIVSYSIFSSIFVSNSRYLICSVKDNIIIYLCQQFRVTKLSCHWSTSNFRFSFLEHLSHLHQLHCFFSWSVPPCKLLPSFSSNTIPFQISRSFHRFIIFLSHHMTHPSQSTCLYHLYHFSVPNCPPPCNSFFQTQSIHELTYILSLR